MLMKVVLPAPLLPIRPTTVSCSIAALMSAAAVTAPKLLFRPLGVKNDGHLACRLLRVTSDHRPSGRNMMTSSSAMPSAICQVFGE